MKRKRVEYTTVNGVWNISATRKESGFCDIDGFVRGKRGTFCWAESLERGFFPEGSFMNLPVYVRQIVHGICHLLNSKEDFTQNDVKQACGYYG